MADRTGWSWPLKLGLGVLALLMALGLAVAWWMPNNEELAARVRTQAEEGLGVPVRLGEVRWGFFPLALVVEDAATEQPVPIRVGRMVAEPVVRDLLRRQLRLRQLTIQDAVLPQLSLRELRIRSGAGGADAGRPVVEHLRLERLTWVTRQGLPLAFDANIFFDAGWNPREGELARVEVETPTRVSFRRLAPEQRWEVQARLGGGTASGEVALARPEGGKLQFTGRLDLQKVEVHSAMAAFQRNSVLRGAASGTTDLAASGATLPDLVRSLHTRTRFTMAPATLLRIDVDKAIRSFGKDRAGQTQMASLAGQMETQNSSEGMVFRYRGLEAKGETFSARGAATIANRRVNAEGTVDLVDGLIGVPLKVSGPLGSPNVSVPGATSAGATSGAVIGTAVLPGVGTVIGAGVGAAIGKILGKDGAPKAPPALPRSP